MRLLCATDLLPHCDARAQAGRATRLRDEMLAVVAHDLRNPLHTVAIGLATILKLPLPDDERANRQLVIMQHSVRSMNRLTLDLLDVTRIELAGSRDNVSLYDSVCES